MTLFLIFMGLCFLVIGFRMIYFDDKYWWWSKSSPVVPTSIVFAAFPFALALFVMASLFMISAPVEMRQNIAFFVIFPLMLIGVLLSIWQPRWLKPKWARWLEANHGEIMPLLREEARKAEWSDWQRKVDTQKGLEEWVDEVRERNNL